MTDEHKYSFPSHLTEPIRIQIATDYLKQDARKMFPALRGKSTWEVIDNDINKWFDQSSTVIGVRDFWNRFDGIAMGGKLKVGLLQVVTAENIHWELVENLSLDDQLASGGGYSYIDPSLNRRRLRASELKKFSEEPQHKLIVDQWRKIFVDQANLTESRDEFAIIAVEEAEDSEVILSIHDGNRRMAQSVFNGQTSIRAYVGRYTTNEKKPKNFWLPTSFLMEMVKEAELLGTETAYQHSLGLLQEYQSLSESGRHELFERVLIGNHPVRERLKNDLLK